MSLIIVKLLLFFILIGSLNGVCSAAPLAEQRTQDDVYYRGVISQQENEKFFKSLTGIKPRRLRVSSTGGEVTAGIELGYWVHENKLDVVVEDICLSSCANYVFPAGVNKFILPGAVVAWHGNYHHLLVTGLWREEIETRMSHYQESRQQAQIFVHNQVSQLVRLEKEFFNKIAVDESLCWIAKMPPYQVVDYYFLSVKDMARFGVGQVRAPEHYPESDVSHWPVSIIYVDLND